MLDGMKNCSVLIERFTLSGAIGGIEHALFPDLKQELASVVRIFLHHAGWSASDPHVVVLIEVTAVEACFEKLGIAPRINHVARGINLNYERSHAPGVQVDVQTSCRLRMNTWSWRSTQTPPNPPSTHRSGNGFGQDRSTSYFGAPFCACDGGGQRIPVATANSAQPLPLRRQSKYVDSGLRLLR